MNSNKARKMSRSNTPNPKKKLRFSDTSTIIMIVPKTSSEKKATWYDRDSIRKFKRDVWQSSSLLNGTCDSKLMRLMGHYVLEGIQIHDEIKAQNINSIRGLEHMDRGIAKVLIQGRRMTIDGVLQEQARQNELGVRDIFKIATISYKHSRFSVGWRQRIVAL